MRGEAYLAAVCALAACGDNLDPITRVSSGRLTAIISQHPAQIALAVDGTVVWSTARGGGPHADGPPYAFASIGTLSVTVDNEFGSYKFTEDTAAEHWRVIDELDAVETSDS